MLACRVYLPAHGARTSGLRGSVASQRQELAAIPAAIGSDLDAAPGPLIQAEVRTELGSGLVDTGHREVTGQHPVVFRVRGWASSRAGSSAVQVRRFRGGARHR